MIYFASDTHLGLRTSDINPREKEARFVQWLQSINDCTELFLLGDIFDYWFEYGHVVRKGYVRLLGQLASMSDRGVKIHFFAGNHDLWHRDYFSSELGIELHLHDEIFERNGKRILLSHGDALGGKLSLLGMIFRSRTLRWPFERFVHPDLSMRFGNAWSLHNRLSRSVSHPFRGEEEPLVKCARKVLAGDSNLDYIVCGHIHIPLDYSLNERTRLIVLGQWVIGDPVVAMMDSSGTISLQTVK